MHWQLVKVTYLFHEQQNSILKLNDEQFEAQDNFYDLISKTLLNAGGINSDNMKVSEHVSKIGTNVHAFNINS